MEVAASVVGLLSVAAKVAIVVNTISDRYSDAPSLLRTINIEINDFRFIIGKLKPLAVGLIPLDQERGDLVDVNHLQVTLEGCMWTFSELERIADGFGTMNILDRLRLLTKESKLLQLMQRLQQHKASLSLIVGILTRYILLHHKKNTSNVSSETVAQAIHSRENLDEIFSNKTAPPLAGPYLMDFESTLYLSRPYRTMTHDSTMSTTTEGRRKPRWSLYTRGSNDSVYSLPISIQSNSLSGITLVDVESLPSLSISVPPDSLSNLLSYSEHYQPPTDASLQRTALLHSIRQPDLPNIETLLAHPAYNTHNHPDLRQALYQCIILGDSTAVYNIYITHGDIVYAACEFIKLPPMNFFNVAKISGENYALLATWAGIVFSSHHVEEHRNRDDPLMWIT